MSRTIVITANTGWNIAHYREHLLRHLLENGYDVYAVASYDESSYGTVRAMGVTPISIPLKGSGKNPWWELRTILALARCYRDIKPDIVHHFTTKPVIYGSLAARWANVDCIVNGVTGLGSAYGHDGSSWMWKVLKRLYSFALKNTDSLVVYNEGDRAVFINDVGIPSELLVIIPGSGVSCDRLSELGSNVATADHPLFVLVGRMLKTKGIEDFVKAGEMVVSEIPEARCLLIGGSSDKYGSKNSSFIRKEWLLERKGPEGKWIGFQSPKVVARTMAAATAVVLPAKSREGLPRTLLEAAALGTPVITTDVPGCKDAVVHGQTGYICPVSDPAALSRYMIKLARDRKRAHRMGQAAQDRARAIFDERIINQKILNIYMSRNSDIHRATKVDGKDAISSHDE